MPRIISRVRHRKLHAPFPCPVARAGSSGNWHKNRGALSGSESVRDLYKFPLEPTCSLEAEVSIGFASKSLVRDRALQCSNEESRKTLLCNAADSISSPHDCYEAMPQGEARFWALAWVETRTKRKVPKFLPSISFIGITEKPRPMAKPMGSMTQRAVA